MEPKSPSSFGEIKEMVPTLDTIINYEFERTEEQEEVFREFFHLKNDYQISQGERSDFILLYKHLLKRVILSLKSNSSSLYAELENYKTQLEDEALEKNHDQFTFKNFDELMIVSHDVAHAVGNIINGRFNLERKLYPIFTEQERGTRLPDKTMMEDELYSSLFSFGNSYVSHLALSIDSQEYCSTFEEYLDSYIGRVMSLTVGSIIGDLESDYDKNPNLIHNIRVHAEKIAEEIRKNPPAKVVECLHYIWDHRDNPRVLVDLFFQEVGPYIGKLKQRKVYTIKE